MMTTTTPTTSRATELFQELNALYPSLPEPQAGATSYAMMVAENPTLDATFCQQAGKVIHITAQLSERCDTPVAIRGETGPLSWTADRLADSQIVTDFYQREFTMHVPTDQMNTTVQYKLVVPGRTPHETMRWQQGNNNTIDLSQYGHIVKVKVSGVSFQ